MTNILIVRLREAMLSSGCFRRTLRACGGCAVLEILHCASDPSPDRALRLAELFCDLLDANIL